jgi:CRP-like cAMP-binding protein
VIVAEDDIDDDVFFILSGHARAATYTDRGREVMLSELPAGEAFGFFAAIDGKPRSTNVVSVVDSRIARMAAADFRNVLYNHPEVNRAFMLYLVDRIRSTSGRFTTVATQNAEQRLISEILRLAKPGQSGGDTAVIDPVPTQKEFALLTFAAHREAVGRDMSKLRDAGLVERTGRKLMIKSLSGLTARLSVD